jgi:hypothetical protein
MILSCTAVRRGEESGVLVCVLSCVWKDLIGQDETAERLQWRCEGVRHGWIQAPLNTILDLILESRI